MPHYCYLETDLRCPSCATIITDYLAFQWGFSPGRLQHPDYTYHLGDAIRWKSMADGSIPPWTYFETPKRRSDHELPPGASPRLADPALWQPRPDGSLPANDLIIAGEKWIDPMNPDIHEWLRRRDRNRGANLGDATYANLITREMQQFYWETPSQRRCCPMCGHVLEGAALEIRDNVIIRAWAYEPGELDNAVGDYVIEPDGTLRPRPDWSDMPMQTAIVDDE